MQRLLLFLAFLMISAGIYAEEQPLLREVPTRLGVGKVGQRGAWNQVTLNGKTVYRATGDRNFILMRGHFVMTNADVLLLSLGCACSDGVPDPLVFLVLETSGKVQAVTDKRFFSSDGTIRPRTVDGIPEVDLGFEGGRVKIASLRSGSISIAFHEAPTKLLEEKDCRPLYERMASECTKPTQYERSCGQDMETWYSRATLFTLRAYEQHPGFKRPGWDGSCRATCQGSPPDYSKFRKEACSVRAP